MHCKTIWILSLLSFLFSACSSKEEKVLFQVYNQEKQYNKKLLHTEKIQLYDRNETQVLLTATYLFQENNRQKEDNTEDEVFIVGLNMENEKTRDLLSKDLNLTLEGTLPKSVKILKNSDKSLKDIPIVTEWGDYFKVTFPHTTRQKFDLVFSSKKYGTKKLHFAKKAKYVFTKEAF